MPNCFSKQVHHFILSPSLYESSNLSTSLPSFVVSCFLNYSHHCEHEWYLTVGLICIFLMADDTEHLFMCSLAILISFFWEMFIKILCPPFLHWIVFLLLSCKSSLYILDTKPISVIWFANLFCGLSFPIFLDFKPTTWFSPSLPPSLPSFLPSFLSFSCCLLIYW